MIRRPFFFIVLSLIVLSLGLSISLLQAQPSSTSEKGNLSVSQEARGTFEVSMNPESSEEATGVTLGRMTLNKQYQGDLVATGKGEMLTARTETKGSASYAAFEWVSGTLHGKEGSFVLHHHGTMARGDQELKISIVPDSGTGELQGISGHCKIEISEGKHSYEFKYSLPE